MDRLNIPNYSAVLPGTEDVIWVYGGKGPTRSHAKASALMEVIERYSSLSGSCERAFIQGNYLELSKSYRKVIHPDEVVEPVNQEFDEKKTISNYLAGFDLLSHEEVLVPAGLALYMHSEIKSPAVSMFPSFHTNGLASGNAIEEAICHALCEVIEIDAVSIADLCASCMRTMCPFVRFLYNNLFANVVQSQMALNCPPVRRITGHRCHLLVISQYEIRLYWLFLQ
jgi:ribosomal protein S12 methylthiotransferase accessory factor